MRISDWSSDVCSSDLRAGEEGGGQRQHRQAARCGKAAVGSRIVRHRELVQWGRTCGALRRREEGRRAGPGALGASARSPRRSEEHTSELQSLMRISYAVFCLKKKNRKQTVTNTTNVLT